MRLALYQPDIPQNTGTLLRTAACLGIALDVIGPTGFDMTDRALKRAGLDYLDHADLTRHESFDAFEHWRRACPPPPRLVLISAHAPIAHLEFAYRPTDILMLGRESAGVPDRVLAVADAAIRIPLSPGLRSLNVAIAGAIVLAEALRQTSGFPRAR
ncbi:MAG: tRNA (cytidine(34)-2'-O)-methyltransferase [Hyphomicrobium sp.]